MIKYDTLKVAGVIVSICKSSKTKDFKEKVIDVFLPDYETLNALSRSEEKQWISENNNRMKQICDFMNENNL